MKIQTKLASGFIALLVLIIMNSIVSVILHNRVSDSYSALAIQTLPVINALQTIQISALTVFGITNEILFLNNEQALQGRDIGFSSEEELAELHEGFELFETTNEEYARLVRLYFPKEEEYLIKINYYWEKFADASDTLVTAKLSGIGAEEIIKDKDIFEAAQRRLFEAITSAIDKESDEVSERKAAIIAEQQFFRIMIIIILLISLMLSVFVPTWVTYSVIRPLRRLTAVAHKVGTHDFSEKSDLKTSDEFQTFSDVFDNMIVDISKSTVSISDLEKRVKLRTKDLEEKNIELEDFNELVVGRELVLAEQKKEIARLNALLKEKK